MMYRFNNEVIYTSVFPNDFPKSNERTNNTIKMKNRIFAIEAAPAAIPPNPKTAAMMATIRNVTVQRNIMVEFRFTKLVYAISILHNRILCQTPETRKFNI